MLDIASHVPGMPTNIPTNRSSFVFFGHLANMARESVPNIAVKDVNPRGPKRLVRIGWIRDPAEYIRIPYSIDNMLDCCGENPQ